MKNYEEFDVSENHELHIKLPKKARKLLEDKAKKLGFKKISDYLVYVVKNYNLEYIQNMLREIKESVENDGKNL